MPSPKWKSSLQKNSNNDSKNEGVSRRTEDPQQEIQIKDVNSFIKRKKKYCNLIILQNTIARSILLRNNLKENVINLSKYLFTKGQGNVLHETLHFCPTPGYYNKEEFKRFTWKIKLGGRENEPVIQEITFLKVIKLR